MGAQLNYINQLRGTCPEGYEVERYMRGGCVKCKKSSDDPVSRFKKHREGDTLRQDST
jgi:transcriptional regulator CtsR